MHIAKIIFVCLSNPIKISNMHSNTNLQKITLFRIIFGYFSFYILRTVEDIMNNTDLYIQISKLQ